MKYIEDNILSNEERTIQVWHGADLIGSVADAGFHGIFAWTLLAAIEINCKGKY